MKKRILYSALLCLLAICMLVSCTETPAETSSEAVSEASSEASSAEESSVIESSEESSEPPREVSMSYEIPNNYNDKYSDTFGVEDFVEMEIKSSNNTYAITYYYPDGGSYRTHLVKKRWGVWMLGAMEHRDANGKTVQMSSSSTDYEWVSACGKTTSSITFRGGNHGDYATSDWNADDSSKSNDRLLDMTFYDAKTGEKVEIEEGATVKVNGLRVVIHTNIYDGEYNEDNVLICTEKLYLFNGEDVFVQSELFLAQDTYFKITYSCMFPVSKSYGNYILFHNDDGTTTLVKTPLTGKSNYGSNFSNHHKSSKVTLFGEKAPGHRMTVQIYNPEDMFCQSQQYTMLWDMNPSSNKLYFSSFTNSKATKIEKGTVWTYCSSWSFSYDPDATLPDDSEIDEKLGF